MLGEGARTGRRRRALFRRLCRAIAAIGAGAGNAALPDRPGISVKLSALHPRFEAVSRARVLAELVPDVIELARQAREHDLNFTVDAEEADRLELTLDVHRPRCWRTRRCAAGRASGSPCRPIRSARRR